MPAESFDTTCFALLDDRDATRQHPASRLYQGFVREHGSTLQIHDRLVGIVELKTQPFGFAAVLTRRPS